MSHTTQCAAILALLRARGADGASSLELARLALRYGQRILELRRRGFDIETERRDGRFVYRLHERVAA